MKDANMCGGDYEIISAHQKAADAFIEALANGNSCAAAQCLRQLDILDGAELSIMADLLDEKAHPSLFPWRLVVRARQAGRMAKRNKQFGEAEPNNSDQFFNALSDRNTTAAADFLRRVKSLTTSELEILADLLDNNPQADMSLPWRLKFIQRRRGEPVDSLRSNANYFTRASYVAKAGAVQRKAAIGSAMDKTGLSRATIQRARRRTKPKHYK